MKTFEMTSLPVTQHFYVLCGMLLKRWCHQTQGDHTHMLKCSRTFFQTSTYIANSRWYISRCCTKIFNHVYRGYSKVIKWGKHGWIWDESKVSMMHYVANCNYLSSYEQLPLHKLAVSQLRHAPLKHSDCKKWYEEMKNILWQCCCIWLLLNFPSKLISIFLEV